MVITMVFTRTVPIFLSGESPLQIVHNSYTLFTPTFQYFCTDVSAISVTFRNSDQIYDDRRSIWWIVVTDIGKQKTLVTGAQPSAKKLLESITKMNNRGSLIENLKEFNIYVYLSCSTSSSKLTKILGSLREGVI